MKELWTPLGGGFPWARSIQGIGRVPFAMDGLIGLSIYDHRKWETNFEALDATTGEVRWSTRLESTAYSRATGDGHHFFAPFGPTRLAALRAVDGRIDWVLDTGARIRSSPSILGEDLVLAAGPRILRIHRLDGQVRGEYSNKAAFFFGEPLVLESLILVQGSEYPEMRRPTNFVYALDADSLDLRWRAAAGAGVVVSCDTSGLAHGNDLIVAGGGGGFDGILRALEPSTGSKVWECDLQANLVRSRPTYHDGFIYVTSPDLSVAVVDAHTGALRFSSQLYEEGAWGPALVAGERLFVHSGPSPFALDRSTGRSLSEWPIGYHSYTAPVLAPDGSVVICGGDPPDGGYVYCIDPARSDLGRSTTRFPIATPHDAARAQIEIEFRSPSTATKPTLDARSLEGSAADAMIRMSPTTFVWEGSVPRHVRHSRWTGTLAIDGVSGRSATVLADFRTDEDAPAAYEINDVPVSIQISPIHSGPATIENFLRFYGTDKDQSEIMAMGDWIVKSHGLDLHHKWRTGSLRIFHGSGNRQLPEMVSANQGARAGHLVTNSEEEVIS